MTDGGQRPVALVTGAAKRVGATIARTLHAAGYDIALHARNSYAEQEALALELEALRPDSTLTLQAELADVDCLPDLVDAVLARFGHLDALVNNASAFYPTPLATVTPSQWDELFAANARAPLFLAQAAAPALRKAQGAIVNIADIHADRPLKNYVVYSMAKAGLVGLTRSLARELAPEVRVNAVAPGPVLWPDDESFDELSRQRIISNTPLKREGTPEDIAGAVYFLLAEAHYVTGETINVDGGRHIAI